MGKKRPAAVAGRAWRLLRLAVLWARKGGPIFKLKLMLDLKALRARARARKSNRIGGGERELSFDETPIFHLKMHRPESMRHLRIPCISSPAVDDLDDYDYDHLFFKREPSEIQRVEDYDSNSNNNDDDDDDDEDRNENIDMKADEFIEGFYNQMKMQRQVSFLKYMEMLQRGTN